MTTSDRKIQSLQSQQDKAVIFNAMLVNFTGISLLFHNASTKNNNLSTHANGIRLFDGDNEMKLCPGQTIQLSEFTEFIAYTYEVRKFIETIFDLKFLAI